jgi:hypothetical protein
LLGGAWLPLVTGFGLSLVARAAAATRSLVDADMDGVARPFADRLAEHFDGQPVRAVALRHQRAVERIAIDRAADLDEPARAEELRRASITAHVHAPELSPF